MFRNRHENRNQIAESRIENPYIYIMYIMCLYIYIYRYAFHWLHSPFLRSFMVKGSQCLHWSFPVATGPQPRSQVRLPCPQQLDASIWLSAITNCTAEVATSCGSGDLEGMKPRHSNEAPKRRRLQLVSNQESTMLHRVRRLETRLDHLPGLLKTCPSGFQASL